MTFRDDLPHRDEAESLGGRVGDDAAGWETGEIAPTDELTPQHEIPARQESSAAAIPWPEPPKRSGRPANAKLLMGLGIGGAVVLVIAIVWAMFTKQDASRGLESGGNPSASSSASAQSASPSSTSPPGSGGGTPVPMADPDGAGQSCAAGFHVKGREGFGTRAVRGSKETSCAFASKVLEAYWVQVGTPTKDPERITAAGTVPCSSTGGECSGDNFVMKCAAQNNEDWITCVGGKNARVYIY
jgi:serine/threonine protein kinase, bacterial